MHSKNFYFNMAITHFVAMLLFIIVFYVGLIMRHWLTFDVGLFGAIIACISTVYNVTKYENASKIEDQINATLIEMIKDEEEKKKTEIRED